VDGNVSSIGPYIGTAAWVLPRDEQHRFPAEGTHLERYASRFTAVEINSSFYRPHRAKTYQRWAASVPEGFRFSVKVPKVITHERRLRDAAEPLDAFLAEAGGLGGKLGCLLVQLPPSFAFDHDDVIPFFELLRERTHVPVVCEPRHKSWASDSVDDLLTELRVARVMADPVRIPGGEDPGGWTDVVYYRLHGSPETYRSCYSDELLESMAHRIEEDLAEARQAWCIFDNTARNFATPNGLQLLDRLASGPQL
jgi:uncharacterized protein YecE (DUF72 family)